MLGSIGYRIMAKQMAESSSNRCDIYGLASKAAMSAPPAPVTHGRISRADPLQRSLVKFSAGTVCGSMADVAATETPALCGKNRAA